MKESIYIMFSIMLIYFINTLLDVHFFLQGELILCFILLSAFVYKFYLNNNFLIKKNRDFSFYRCRLRFYYFMLLIVVMFVYALLMNKLGFNVFGVFVASAYFMLPFFVVGLGWFIFWSDTRLTEDDRNFIFIKNVINKNVSRCELKYHFLTNLLKVFFIPLMVSFSIIGIKNLLWLDIYELTFAKMVVFAIAFGLCVDVFVATAGYIFTTRFLESDLKSVDTTITGWLVCVICYPPLFNLVANLIEQRDNLTWQAWLKPDQALFYIWGSLLGLAWFVYWMSTLSFGFKFSNLSYRGLVSNGLYKYMKHPAYLSKNIYWWMVTVPFFGVVGFDVFYNCLALVAINIIYYLRAKTEERHLMKYPEYQEYCAYIAQFGLYAQFKKLFIFRLSQKNNV